MAEEELGVFPVDVARSIHAAYKRLIASGLLDDTSTELSGQAKRRRQDRVADTSPIPFRNDSGHTIPPFGLMQVSGTFNETNSCCYAIVKRPIDSTLMRSPLLINGPRECLVDEKGTAQSGPVYRLLHDASVTYEPGDRLGSQAGSFAAKYGALYSVLGMDTEFTNVAKVMFDTSAFKGRTKSGGLNVGTPANVFFRDAAGTVTTKEYLAETDVSNIPGNTDIWLFPMYGRLVASRVC